MDDNYLHLREQAVSAMANARGNDLLIKAAITAYVQEGLRFESPEALTDYFCVDTPSILDDAKYTEAEADHVVAMFDEIATRMVREFMKRNS